MKDIVAGHQISFRFRGEDNKPTGHKLIIDRNGEKASIRALVPDSERGEGYVMVHLGADTCNNVTKWLEAVHAFLTLDIPTLDTIKEEGNREAAAQETASPVLAGKVPGVIA